SCLRRYRSRCRFRFRWQEPCPDLAASLCLQNLHRSAGCPRLRATAVLRKGPRGPRAEADQSEGWELQASGDPDLAPEAAAVTRQEAAGAVARGGKEPGRMLSRRAGSFRWREDRAPAAVEAQRPSTSPTVPSRRAAWSRAPCRACPGPGAVG